MQIAAEAAASVTNVTPSGSSSARDDSSETI